MAAPLSRKDPAVRAFELSLQGCASLEKQREKMTEHHEDFLHEVAEIVVKIMDFKKTHPGYVLPKSFSIRMCTHLLAGHCTFDSNISNTPCLNPHRYALRRAAIHIQNMSKPFWKKKPCDFGDKCTFKENCKFLHTDDILINEFVQQIFQNRIAAQTEVWKTVGKGARPAAEQPVKDSSSPDSNMFACLHEEDGSLDTTESDSNSDEEANDPSPLKVEYQVRKASSLPTENAIKANMHSSKAAEVAKPEPSPSPISDANPEPVASFNAPQAEEPVERSPSPNGMNVIVELFEAEEEQPRPLFAAVQDIYESVFDQEHLDDPLVRSNVPLNASPFVNDALLKIWNAGIQLDTIVLASEASLANLRARAALAPQVPSEPRELVPFQFDSVPGMDGALEANPDLDALDAALESAPAPLDDAETFFA